jgi:hypothetical protein
MLRILVLLIALASPAAAQQRPPIDDAQRAALMLALRYAGVVVGATLPIGNAVYEIEEVQLARDKAGELTITVRTKLLR